MSLIPGTGSVPLSRRAGGPDLARGLALLGIALANTVGWLHGSQWTVLLKQLDATVPDRIADALIGLLADNRGFPLFAMLFGYGIGILYRRSREHGERTGHFVLRMLRRHVALFAIGLAHAVLLFSGDIIVAYAMVGMLCVLLMTRHRVVLPLAGLLALPALGVWGWADGTVGFFGTDGYAAAAAPDYLTSLGLRTVEAGSEVVTTLLSDIGLLAPMAIGAIIARLRLFEEVATNRDVLVPIARWGLGIGLVGAVPLVAVLIVDPVHELLTSETLLGTLGVLHQYTGLIGALGLAAAASLLADHVRHRQASTAGAAERRLEAAVRGIEALGAVSLSAYVGQSLVFLALFPPYTLDLGARLGTAGAAAIVVVVWLLMIPPAMVLRRHGRRGPLEVALRRLAGSGIPRAAVNAPARPRSTGGRP